MSPRRSPQATRLLEREISRRERAVKCDPEENELARLIVEVRQAGERLCALIAVLEADRARWEQRERQWTCRRDEIVRNTPMASDKVH